MSLRARWFNFRQRLHPTAAKIAIVFASALAAVYSWSLASIMRRLYFPEPGRRCATPEVGALLVGAVIVAPAAFLLAATQVAIRRALPDRPVWRTLSYTALVVLLLLVVANWLALIKLIWF
jgi:hypothetical protein